MDLLEARAPISSVVNQVSIGPTNFMVCSSGNAAVVKLIRVDGVPDHGDVAADHQAGIPLADCHL